MTAPSTSQTGKRDGLGNRNSTPRGEFHVLVGGGSSLRTISWDYGGLRVDPLQCTADQSTGTVVSGQCLNAHDTQVAKHTQTFPVQSQKLGARMLRHRKALVRVAVVLPYYECPEKLTSTGQAAVQRKMEQGLRCDTITSISVVSIRH